MSTHKLMFPVINIMNFLCLFVIFFNMNPSDSAMLKDTIFRGQGIRDWQQLNSSSNLFTLQFYRPSATTNDRYLGIFLNMHPGGDRPVWVANRDNPIPDASESLTISADGDLKITYNARDLMVLSSAAPEAGFGNVSATLLDNGNFVFRVLNLDGSVNRTMWQSFDYPTDTLLPGMKLGINFKTGARWTLISSVSDKVPASGSFTLGTDPNATAQLMIWWQEKVLWSSGRWKDGQFTCTRHDSLHFTYVKNQDEEYFLLASDKNSTLTTYRLEIVSWIDPNGLCLEPTGWYYTNNVEPGTTCGLNMMLPKCLEAEFWFEQRQGYTFGESLKFDDYNLSLFDCEAKCVQNCSCIAYATIGDNGTGCEIWSPGMQILATSGTGGPIRQVFFRHVNKGSTGRWWSWFFMCVIITFSLFLASTSWCLIKRRIRSKAKAKPSERMLLGQLGSILKQKGHLVEDGNGELHLSMSPGMNFFGFDTISTATNNFSAANKLGEGGFGQVYKGKLIDGQEVAIKRLSRNSGQGLVEFKNEIQLIAKLQHNNLVRLLGFSIQADEKVLVYEYMTNKSLDFHLFDPSKKGQLKWAVRMNIIEGVAQGLLYLHKHSRLRVVHRDLKASNILLDSNMNPKISDFGMARIFGMGESEANTKRIVGTYGYMSPEYAIKGIVSVKTDVFSYGVLLLEIICGQRNYSSYQLEHPLNLVGMAWELWKDGRDLELMDPTLEVDSSHHNEVRRCIHVGLLCVQDHALDRPSMSNVVSMITNDSTKLPAPKQPAFFIERVAHPENIQDELGICSVDDGSISIIEPR